MKTLILTLILVSQTAQAACVLATFTKESFPLASALIQDNPLLSTSVVKLKETEDRSKIACFVSYGSALGKSDDAQRLADTLAGSRNPESHLYGLAAEVLGVNNCRRLRRSFDFNLDGL